MIAHGSGHPSVALNPSKHRFDPGVLRGEALLSRIASLHPPLSLFVAIERASSLGLDVWGPKAGDRVCVGPLSPDHAFMQEARDVGMCEAGDVMVWPAEAAVTVGTMYFDTSTNQLYTFDHVGWQEVNKP